jgi:hypothetical protein
MTSEGQPAVIADLPASLPTVPRYGESSLADLATSVLASLGVAGEANPLELAPAERVCLLVVDGLGWELLREHPAAAPFLSELAVAGRLLTAGFPATTATSLASLGTGRPPGQHGLLGYQVAVPGQNRLLNALHWDQRIDPVAWQPGSTIFERAAAAGVDAYRVSHSGFRQTGLFVAAMRGGRTGRWPWCITVSWTRPGTRSAAHRTPGAITWGTWKSWPSSWPGRCHRAPPCT